LNKKKAAANKVWLAMRAKRLHISYTTPSAEIKNEKTEAKINPLAPPETASPKSRAKQLEASG
jgi:hypothetical protein